jgi:hypothetical protein
VEATGRSKERGDESRFQRRAVHGWRLTSVATRADSVPRIL